MVEHKLKQGITLMSNNLRTYILVSKPLDADRIKKHSKGPKGNPIDVLMVAGEVTVETSYPLYDNIYHLLKSLNSNQSVRYWYIDSKGEKVFEKVYSRVDEHLEVIPKAKNNSMLDAFRKSGIINW